MSSAKHKSKKIPLNSTDSDEDSEHELFYYANDRIKLMKEVLKLIKPKKIKSIAPDFMKNLDIDEINSILLEELLGISNKRLKHILNGEKVDIDSSSSESEQEQKPIDIISLDDISDTDDDFGLGGTNSNINKDNKHKEKHKHSKTLKDIKSEKGEQSKKKESNSEEKVNTEIESDKLMNVLEILELQARARAIRSQLALENVNKKTNAEEKTHIIEDDEDVDAVIVSSPRNEHIVITSESEDDKEPTKLAKKIEINSINSNKSKSDDITTSLSNNKEKDTVSEPLHKSIDSQDITCNEQKKMSPKYDNVQMKIQKSEAANTINSDSNNYVENESNEDNEDKTNAPYKSDSDNDVINLDSEDIDNV